MVWAVVELIFFTVTGAVFRICSEHSDDSIEIDIFAIVEQCCWVPRVQSWATCSGIATKRQVLRAQSWTADLGGYLGYPWAKLGRAMPNNQAEVLFIAAMMAELNFLSSFIHSEKC